MILDKLCLKDVDLTDKKVLLRVDFNVPLSKGVITDDTRIKMSLPTISYLLNQNASIILISHLGRPEGQKNLKYSLRVCKERLENLLNHPVLFCDDCIDDKAQLAKRNLKKKEILLLENLRFYPEEESPDDDPTFAYKLAEFADFYVDDAFATAHRAHSSIVAITQYFPHQSLMGFLMENEFKKLNSLIQAPIKPFYAIIGGAKISSKIGILESLLTKCDKIFIGGAMALTFLSAMGYEIGSTVISKDLIDIANLFLKKAKESSCKVFFPKDTVVSKSTDDRDFFETKLIEDGIPSNLIGVDIGEKTLAYWKEEIQDGKTIFWNGPVGVFENPNFSKGTFSLARMIGSIDANKIVGGGDSVAAISQLGIQELFTHVSTGGGASLEFIEYGHLPGIDVLSNKN